MGQEIAEVGWANFPVGGNQEKTEEWRKWALCMQEICTREVHEHQQAADKMVAAQLAAQKEENQQLAARVLRLEKESKNKHRKLASCDAVKTRQAAKKQSGDSAEKK